MNWIKLVKISLAYCIFVLFLNNLHASGDHCQVTIGIASGKHRLNEAPGMDIDTVGYNSHSGLLYSNRKELGNTRGHRCRQGDTIGVEIQTFGEEMSVVLFTKNFRPVGTRYLTLKNHQQFFPTILIDSNTESVELSAYWQNRISVPLQYNIVCSDSCSCIKKHRTLRNVIYFYRKISKIGVYQRKLKLIYRKNCLFYLIM